jgi:hypothetical protein
MRAAALPDLEVQARREIARREIFSTHFSVRAVLFAQLLLAFLVHALKQKHKARIANHWCD